MLDIIFLTFSGNLLDQLFSEHFKITIAVECLTQDNPKDSLISFEKPLTKLPD